MKTAAQQYENTKALIASLENPALQGIKEPSFLNSFHAVISFFHGEVEFDFDVFLPSIGENLQREFVWSLQKQKSFIATIFERKDYIPNIVVNVIRHGKSINDSTYRVIDGKQRLTTILRFMNNEFDLNGYYFRDLGNGFISYVDRLKFETYYDNLPDSVLVALFEKVNFFAEPQDYERFERIKSKIQNHTY